ncbi:hypothetical protein EIP91_010597 [Steccherinum ochraceum]|uniref:DNA 3'-5' helicase n=1 Tax=Steccherinum ochraceum TaxID=92696 RepID=A0A4R0R0G6_9APHY|nr:hypothetical protein EIP91_010597 [Steccherinum ochraceum]
MQTTLEASGALPYPCDPCPESLRQNKAHHRAYHQASTTFKLAGQSITVQRNGTGYFKCPFCLHGFRVPGKLREHCSEKHPLQPTTDASDVPQDASDVPPDAFSEPQDPYMNELYYDPSEPFEFPPEPTQDAVSGQFHGASGSLNAPGNTPVNQVAPGPSHTVSGELETGVTHPPLELLPHIDPSELHPVPTVDTVLEHDGVNLLKLNFSINTTLCVAVCAQCSKFILPPTDIGRHVLLHHRHAEVSSTLVPQLIELYNLKSAPQFPSKPIPPVFGLPISADSRFICGVPGCHRGYSTVGSLNSHQSARNHDRPDLDYVAYVQRDPSSSRRFFPVELNDVPRRDVVRFDPSRAFTEAITRQRLASERTVAEPEDKMGLNAFFKSEQWIGHLEGHSVLCLADAHRLHLAVLDRLDAGYALERLGAPLRDVAKLMLGNTQGQIRENISYGLMSYLGQATERLDTVYNFNKVESETVTKYSLLLHRLVFSCLRFYLFRDAWTSTYKYPPIAPEQLQVMQDLVDAMQAEEPQEAILLRYELCVRTLLCHRKTQYEVTSRNGRFFSPVCCFLVLQSVDEVGETLPAGRLTQIIAALMYCIRASVLCMAVRHNQSHPELSILELVAKDAVYLRDQQETPMAFAYNASKLLTTIRDAQSNESVFRWVAETELSKQGEAITFAGIANAINSQVNVYEAFIKEHLLFGHDLPDELVWDPVVEDLVEDESCHAQGYSFLNDPRNDLSQHKTKYGNWLLSVPELRERFTYFDGQELVWKSEPCLDWLESLEDSQYLLAVGLILSAGPSARASETARMVLREMNGAPRNVGLVAKSVSLNATQDKTSGRRRKDLFVPHISTRVWQKLLLRYLCIFRAFAEYLVEQLFPPKGEVAKRYEHYLWPGIASHMKNNLLSAAMGTCTKLFIGVEIRARMWRSLVTVIFRKHATRETADLQQDEFYDLMNMHSTLTADKYYNGRTDIPLAPGAASSNILGFRNVAFEWHVIIQIGQDEPIISAETLKRSRLAHSSTNAIDLSGVQKTMVSQFDGLQEALCRAVEKKVVETMAQAANVWWPNPPPPRGEGSLLPVSDIAVHPSRLRKFREFMHKPNAVFSHPQQGVLLELILRGKDNVLGVLATGLGKTYLIMMAAKMYYPKQTIVIVLPLLCLHEDFHSRAKAADLVCERFRPNMAFRQHPNVVTVAIESLEQQELHDYLHSLVAEKQLAFIVLDEIHMALTHANFRQSFSCLMKLNLLGSQIIGLTATLPPHLVHAISETTNNHWRLVRTPTARPNLSYGTRVLETEEGAIEVTLNTLADRMKTYQPQDRAIVYCRSRQDVEDVAAALNVLPYHAGTDSEALTRFESGEQRILVATTALSAGYHHPHVRDIVFMGLPFNPIDLDQMAGRGGRDGLLCRVLVISHPNPRAHAQSTSNDLGESVIVEWFQKRDQCLRIITSKFLDGQPITCILIQNGALCDYCHAELKQAPPPTPLRITAPPPRPLNKTIAPATPRTFIGPPPPRPSNPVRAPRPSVSIRPAHRTTIRPPPTSHRSSSTSTPRAPLTPPSISTKRARTSSSLSTQRPSKSARSSPPEPSSPLPPSSTPQQLDVFHSSENFASSSTAVALPVRPVRPKPSSRPTPSLTIALAEDRTASRLEQQEASWIKHVNQPLLDLFAGMHNWCLICFFKDLGAVEHNLDQCAEDKSFHNMSHHYASLKTAMKMPSGHCYGCLRLNQPWTQHDPNDLTSQCRYRGHLLRLACAYKLWKINDQLHLVPEEKLTNDRVYSDWLKSSSKALGEYDPPYVVMNVVVLGLGFWQAILKGKVKSPFRT